MPYLYSILLILTAFFLETGFLGSLKIYNLVPDLILITVIFFAFNRKISEALSYAIIFGFIRDLIFGFAFGFHLVFFVLLVFGISYFSSGRRAVSIGRVLVAAFLASCINSAFLGLNLYLSGALINEKAILLLTGQIALNIIFVSILFPLYERFFSFLNRVEESSKQRIKI